jgi:hypothetical protein
MSKFTKYVLTTLGFTVAIGAVGFWAAPYAIAQVKAALVRDVDNPGRQFITIEFQFSSYTVPAGKILVIEQVSCVSNNEYVTLNYSGDNGPASNTHRWSMIFQTVPGQFFFNQHVRIYAKGGQTITIGTNNPANINSVFAQGYLLDE